MTLTVMKLSKWLICDTELKNTQHKWPIYDTQQNGLFIALSIHDTQH
jgi:hypothetical protein